MWANNHLNIRNGFLDPETPILFKNTMILYGIPSKIEQLPYLAAILDAILNCENAKSGSLVHPPDSWISWSKALKNAKKRLLPNISRFNTPATGLVVQTYCTPNKHFPTQMLHPTLWNFSQSLLDFCNLVDLWFLLVLVWLKGQWSTRIWHARRTTLNVYWHLNRTTC